MQFADKRGFSLVEFMVAMTLGLILIAGAVSVYLATSRSYTEVEQVAGLAENSRFGLQLLNDSLRHAGFFGGAHPRDIEQDTSLGAVADDCTGDAAFFNLGTYLLADIPSAAGEAFGCVTDALAPVAGELPREVLVVKQVVPRPLYDSDPDDVAASVDGVISFPTGMNPEEVYVIANSERGILLDGSDAAPDVRLGNAYALAAAWPYRMQLYYIRDLPTPTLSRRVLSWDSVAGAMALTTEDLVPGVESLRFRFGVDSTGNGEVDRFMTVAEMALNPMWDATESVEVSLLLRAQAEDGSYVDGKTYNIGGLTRTPGGNWRRQLVQTSVS
ncbi:MAG: PilW family protein, partial [Haliea sp.]|nr:PilW family protein [Haliea sp.]